MKPIGIALAPVEIDAVSGILGSVGITCPPFAEDVAVMSVARRLQEDGLTRPPHWSINGMIDVPEHRRLFEKALRLCPGPTLSRVTANDGQPSLQLKGPQASIVSSLTIALWFRVRTKCPFRWMAWAESDPERYTLEFSGEANEELRRINGMYGPGSERVLRIAERIR